MNSKSLKNPTVIEAALASEGYVARRAETLAVASMLSAPVGVGSPIRAALLEGAPGCGKTALAEALAKVLRARYVHAQLHAWTDVDELFVGVDVAAAVAGDASAVRQDGVLAVVAGASAEPAGVVLCLDEVDKTSERAEALLLDWLQSGRVPVQPSRHLQTNAAGALVFLTSNAQRSLSVALLRRVRRVRMTALPVETVDRMVIEQSAAPKGIVVTLNKAARLVAQAEDTVVSLQELVALAREVWGLAESIEDIRFALGGWAAKTDRGAEEARTTSTVCAVWSEIRTARRAQGVIR